MAESLEMDVGGSGVDPDRLKAFGARAAEMHDGGVPLTQAVLSVVREHDLNAEHVRRVCEHANQAAYSKAWERGGDVRNVTFQDGPADPEAVIRATSATPAPKTDLSDFDSAPSKRGDDIKDLLKIIFGKSEAAPEEKTASPNHRTSVISDLRKAEGHFREKLSTLRLEVHDVGHLLQQAARGAFAVDGYPLTKIAQVFEAIHPAFAREAMDLVTPAIEPLRLAHMPTSIKTAGAIPNPDHPLVVSYRRLCKVGHATKVNQSALDSVLEQLHALEVSP